MGGDLGESDRVVIRKLERARPIRRFQFHAFGAIVPRADLQTRSTPLESPFLVTSLFHHSHLVAPLGSPVVSGLNIGHSIEFSSIDIDQMPDDFNR